MKKILVYVLKLLAGRLGYQLAVKDRELEPQFLDIYQKCKPYTMTSLERMYALYKSVEYVVANKIEGDFVECGVYKGGSAMLMAETLKSLGATRNIYLYDTFEGMSAPSALDKKTGGSAEATIQQWEKAQKENINTWCYSALEDVKENLSKTKFPSENLFYVKGKVEDTIPATVPGKIALLRLDTDWYESTRHELLHLYPLVQSKGVLIIDDYGSWAGAQTAVDEYFKNSNWHPLLNRIDYTGRIVIVP